MRSVQLGARVIVLGISFLVGSAFLWAATDPTQVRERIARGDYADARQAAEEFLESTLSSAGPDSLEVAAARTLLAESLLRAGELNDPRIVDLARLAVEARERALGPDHPDVAESLAVQARILHALSRDDEAGPLFERSLAIDEKSLPPDDPALARLLCEVGDALVWQGGWQKARPLLERALAIQEKVLGPDHPEVARTLLPLGATATGSGSYAEARALFERSLAIRERALGPDHPDVAMSLVYLSGVADSGTREMLERAQAIQERRLGPLHPDLALTLNNLAVTAFSEGNLDEAAQLHRRARAIFEARLGPESPLVGYSLMGEASMLDERGAYGEAIDLLRKALALFEKGYNLDHPAVAGALNNLGRLLFNSGDFAGAKSLWERALAIREKAFGPEHIEVGYSLNNYAFALMNMGSYEEALPLFERALRIHEKHFGPDHPETAASLHNLALDLLDLERYAEARPVAERALAISEKQSDPAKTEIAAHASTLAFAQHGLGRDAEARASLERALSLYEEALGPEHRMVARRKVSLARLLVESGSREQAESLLRSALAILEKQDDPSQAVFTAEVFSNLAELLLLHGDAEHALRLAVRAEETGRSHLDATAAALSEPRALRYAAVRASTLDVLVSLATTPAAGGETARAAWDALVRSRGLVLDIMASRHRSAAEAGDPATKEAASRYAAASRRVANLSVRGRGKSSMEVFRKTLAEARSEKQAAEEVLAARSLAFRSEQSMQKAGLAEVTRVLPSDAALVAYTRYQRYSHLPAGTAPPAANPARGVPSYAAFVLWKNSVAVVPLGDASEIDLLVSALRQAIEREAAAPGISVKRSESVYRKAGDALRRRIWDPLAPHVRGAGTVFVVPDASLNLVPFAGLPVGRSAYLLTEGPLFHYLSAERDLAVLEAPWTPGSGLLAVGGADFDDASDLSAATKPAGSPGVFRGSRSSCGDFRSMVFEPLPASLAESEEVTSLWEPRRGDALRLTGTAATEAAFKQASRGRRVLHLATHGFLMGASCPSAATSVERETLAVRGSNDPAPGGGENPLLLSGLALAGANRRDRADPDEEDGILTAEEVGALDLSGVEWAVLSGCETGVGEIVAGQGVMGLRRAFRIAGARTLIMSLWAVDDQATRDWMSALYRGRLLDGMGTSEAARSAGLAVLRKRRGAGLGSHPFYWAGFVAAGDWR